MVLCALADQSRQTDLSAFVHICPKVTGLFDHKCPECDLSVLCSVVRKMWNTHYKAFSPFGQGKCTSSSHCESRDITTKDERGVSGSLQTLEAYGQCQSHTKRSKTIHVKQSLLFFCNLKSAFLVWYWAWLEKREVIVTWGGEKAFVSLSANVWHSLSVRQKIKRTYYSLKYTFTQ